MVAPQAIFLDRDGVINRERSDYVKQWSEFVFLPGSLEALRHLAALPYKIIIVTNQSVIGRGLASAEHIAMIHQQMTQTIRAAGGRIDTILLCPHHPDARCGCRKPQPGMLLAAAQVYSLALEHCYFVGDSYTDFLAARAAGCSPILVRSGRQATELPALLASDLQVPLFHNLAEAACFLSGTGKRSLPVRK